MTQLQRTLRENADVTEYGADLEPQLEVGQNEAFVVETHDNFFDLIAEPSDIDGIEEHPLLAARQCVRANPLAGPIRVGGISAGDVMAVHIDGIDIREWGWTGTYPGSGIVEGLKGWEEVHGGTAAILRHEPGPSGNLSDGEVVLDQGREYRWPLAPFIGTIATAPERGSENSVIGQGPWGGNLDCREIAAGSTVFLNASHDGGLLFCGDVHASQGDGELTGIANEVAADISLRCEKADSDQIPGVCRIVTPDRLIQVDSARNAGTLERAIDSCYLNLMLWLNEEYGVAKKDAYFQMTANSGVRATLYQACDGLYTVGVSFPRKGL